MKTIYMVLGAILVIAGTAFAQDKPFNKLRTNPRKCTMA